ncbi:hypothetical protein RIVM261_032260 [Rivularia sp. IAM M-261]|nr:hypothetical protein CAL7716_096530 [Calothrix sp. PCC 7716]GJD18270.1 hypothetical protein RIVM261_032260 [Rivularia sp. IAM M-261]
MRKIGIALIYVMTMLLQANSAKANPFAELYRYNVEVRWMPSSSMEPTIHGSPDKNEADKMIIDKTVYRSQKAQRFDIIVFEPTDALREEQYTLPFVKRIVALPGEKVELKNGKIYINNKPLKESFIKNQATFIDVCVSSPTAPYLAKHVIIPQNSYLLMGDNRTQSYDGRCWGTVPSSKIIGKVYQILKG